MNECRKKFQSYFLSDALSKAAKYFKCNRKDISYSVLQKGYLFIPWIILTEKKTYTCNQIKTMPMISTRMIGAKTYSRFSHKFYSMDLILPKGNYKVGEQLEPGEYIVCEEMNELVYYSLCRHGKCKEEFSITGLGYTYVCLNNMDQIDIQCGYISPVENVVSQFRNVIFPDNNRIYRVGTDIMPGSYLIEANGVNKADLVFGHIIYVVSSFPKSQKTVYDIENRIFCVNTGDYVKLDAGSIKYLSEDEVIKYKAFFNKEMKVIQKQGLLLEKDDYRASPIYHIYNNHTMIEGLVNVGHYYNSDLMLGTFKITFYDNNVVTYDNVRSVQYGFMNGKKYSCYSNVKWKTFSESEFNSVVFYIFQLGSIDICDISNEQDHEFSNILYIYHGSKFIHKIENVSRYITVFDSMKFCYTVEDSSKRKYYHHFLYKKGVISEMGANDSSSVVKALQNIRGEMLANEKRKMLSTKDKISIFYHLDYSKKNCIFHEFCNSKAEVKKYHNYFEDDHSINYVASFDSNSIENLIFVAYCLEKNEFACFTIYNQPISKVLVGLPSGKWGFIGENWLYSDDERTYFCDIIRSLYEKGNEDYDGSSLPTVLDKVCLMSSADQYEVLIDYIGLRLAQREKKNANRSDTEFDKDRRRYFYDDYINNNLDELANAYAMIYQNLLLQGKLNILWKSEFSLFSMIKHVFTDALYQYHADWLNRQSIDIYVPSLRIAFEYQGKQHYKPVDFFGGQEAFKYRQQLDVNKKDLCIKNNVELIEWGYNEDINISILKEKLKKIDIIFPDFELTGGLTEDFIETYCKNKNLKTMKTKSQCKMFIYQYDNNGKLLGEYQTVSEAARTSGISSSSILKVINGTRNTAAGFVWKRTPKEVENSSYKEFE